MSRHRRSMVWRPNRSLVTGARGGRVRRSPRSALLQSLRALATDRSVLLGAFILLPILFCAALAPLLAPYSPTAIHMSVRLQGPSWAHPLGTDELGRDLLSRLIFGARVSVSVGMVAVAIASCTGTLLGLVAAYYGGRIDTVVMRAMDGLLAFPSIILALAIMAVLGPRLVNAMIAIGIVYAPVFGRVVRSAVLAMKHAEFVDSARALGASDAYVMCRTIMPNCTSPLLVQMTIGFANAILTEAALSFLGLGVQAPTASWGAMLNTDRQFLTQTARYSFSAGGAIFLAVLSLNLVGDGLRDMLDPRLRTRRAVEVRG